MDFNAHMSNRAYLDICPDVRLTFFAEHGFPTREFERLRLGPVVRRDTLEYFRELHLLESFTVNLSIAGLSADGSRFRLRNEFLRQDGVLTARVTSEGGWLNLDTRKLCPAPPELLRVLASMDRSADYEELASSLQPEARAPIA